MKILLSLTHPQVVGTKQLFGTIDFHSRKKNAMEVNGSPQQFGSNRCISS